MVQDKIDALLTKKTKRRFRRVSIRCKGSTSKSNKSVVEPIRISALDSILEGAFDTEKNEEMKENMEAQK